MKIIGKNILIVLVLGIILTSFISSSEVNSSSNQSSIQETIGDLEEDIEAGLIIQDGNVGSEEVYVEPTNNLGKTTSKVGNFISSLVSAILEFFAKLFGSLLS